MQVFGQEFTSASFVCDYRPLKSEPYRVRLVVGGDRLSYFDDAGAPAATMLETKILLNSVISGAKDGARFMSVDLKDFFLATPMAKAEYMKISIKNFPQDIIDFYKLQDINMPSDMTPRHNRWAMLSERFSLRVLRHMGVSDEFSG